MRNAAIVALQLDAVHLTKCTVLLDPLRGVKGCIDFLFAPTLFGTVVFCLSVIVCHTPCLLQAKHQLPVFPFSFNVVQDLALHPLPVVD
jgi:hypothetical protein